MASTSTVTIPRSRDVVPPLGGLLLALFLFPMSSAAAQAVSGSISGVVRDTSGATVPGATITVTSLERKTVDTVVSNESGFYLKDRLLPGSYEVKAELAGFKTAVLPRVSVSVDTQTPVDFKLELGQLSEQVEVTGGAPLLKTDRADVATPSTPEQMTDLPALDRNFTKFILLTPGTQQLQWQHAASENPQGSTQTMVNGQHFSGTGYQLDGTENRDPILGIIVINPTLESIGEAEDHVAELRRRIRPGGQRASSRCRPSRAATRSSAACFEFYQRRPVPVAQPVHAVPEKCADRKVPARDEEEPVRRLDRRPDRPQPAVLLRRLPGQAQHRRRIAAADRADRGGAVRGSERLRRQHLRPGDRDARCAAAVRRQRHSVRRDCRRRRRHS